MGEREGDSTRPDLGALLAAAVRGEEVDADAEKRALAAFRDARDEGAHGAVRTRRRDDWRPAGERRGWSLRTTLVALAASVTLGGVAVAAIGSGVGGRDDGGERDGDRLPSSSSAADPGAPAGVGTPGAAGASGTSGAAGSGSADRPWTAQDTAAHCRAYDSVKKRGKALDSTAWQRLVRAAGGEDEVAAYCAAQSTEAKEKKNSKSGKDGKSAKEAEKAEKAEKAEARESAKPSKTPGNGVTRSPKAEKSAKSAKSAKNTKSAK
ncbi:hypothetical protein GCM10010372_12620 [Streptomyces tauricus]|uniref:hypothetical protein n=1 Tax=Streptomyces tauricus TaxID=68274 RepID=UPI001677D927|nr:hypothetical protein [Streptomyces tauricus]GHA14448.1 hypothetical protein GCM10010372_12620 [Streptomyces tauricus]